MTKHYRLLLHHHGYTEQSVGLAYAQAVPNDREPITVSGSRKWKFSEVAVPQVIVEHGAAIFNPLNDMLWNGILSIPDEELWRVHERRRTRLVVVGRQRLEQQLRDRGASVEEIDSSVELLNPEALTIGFARRFATYKRATLLFRDLDRLKALLGDRDRPVQFIFAGKAKLNLLIQQRCGAI